MEFGTPQEFEGALRTYFSEINQEINNKYETFIDKLNIKKKELKKLFRQKLIEVSKLNDEINEKSGKDKDGARSKQDIMEDTKQIKKQIEELIKTLESLENYVIAIKDRNISELFKIKEDDFDLIFEFASSSSNENKLKSDGPASQVQSDVCKQCRKKLTWARNNTYSTECSGSTNCSYRFSYACHDCKKKFCNICAYSSNIEICGCGQPMTYSSAPGHECDLCSEHIDDMCIRCSSCDYDVCLTCRDKFTVK